jgi:hypothetical protein
MWILFGFKIRESFSTVRNEVVMWWDATRGGAMCVP